jgi:hypothetical protein
LNPDDMNWYCDCHCNIYKPKLTGWNDKMVCPDTFKYKCSQNKMFTCPFGYYPVCGDLNGLGFKHSQNETMEGCAWNCDNNEKC